ncbi:MAG: hypothetical protein KAJ05_04855 [Candidatus Latescibacteria bacterium]|nr:hypothetical protein [Candidatus Latescibacterota bacterium]MCK5329130.1 hypothetical protein [Candidatus Latescibacterota bacterium]MCK5526455.1 hypothetical protein [Candidatus Latescibacterota bacterium]
MDRIHGLMRRRTQTKSDETMREALLLQELEALAERLDVKVRYGSLEGSGGLCRYGGVTHLILNQSLSVSERIEAFLRALRQLDLNAVFVVPKIREMIEEETGLKRA